MKKKSIRSRIEELKMLKKFLIELKKTKEMKNSKVLVKK